MTATRSSAWPLAVRSAAPSTTSTTSSVPSTAAAIVDPSRSASAEVGDPSTRTTTCSNLRPHRRPSRAASTARAANQPAKSAGEIRGRRSLAIGAPLRLLPLFLPPERGEVQEVVRAAGPFQAAGVLRVRVVHLAAVLQE